MTKDAHHTTPGTSRRLKILMVYPRFPVSFWSFGYIKHIGGFSAMMPPLGLAVLAALTPPEFDVEIVDENIEADRFRRRLRPGRAVRRWRSRRRASSRSPTRSGGAAGSSAWAARSATSCPSAADRTATSCSRAKANTPGRGSWRSGARARIGITTCRSSKIDMRDSPAPRVELF